jgi:hypothetical protein
MLLKLPPEIPRGDGGSEAPAAHTAACWPGGIIEQDVNVGVGVDVGVALCAIAEPNPKARPATKVIAPSKMRDFILLPPS